jgi:5-formyltetrahydrofolate cyclo-ligase
MIITKEQFRLKCLEKSRKKVVNRYILDANVNKKLQKVLFKLSKKRKILFYVPLPNEANIVKSLQKMRKKHQIFIPFMEGKSFKMVPYRLPLKKKKFGIYEAGNSLRNIKKIDIAIVPVVGIDKNFKRVGFGKGMYDRFYQKLQKKPYTIFIQLRKCATKYAVCDDYDVVGDMLISGDCRLEKRR